MLNPYFILQSITTELKVQKQCARGVMYNVLFFTIFQKTQESTCAAALIFTQLFRSLSEKKKRLFQKRRFLVFKMHCFDVFCDATLCNSSFVKLLEVVIMRELAGL